MRGFESLEDGILAFEPALIMLDGSWKGKILHCHILFIIIGRLGNDKRGEEAENLWIYCWIPHLTLGEFSVNVSRHLVFDGVPFLDRQFDGTFASLD